MYIDTTEAPVQPMSIAHDYKERPMGKFRLFDFGNGTGLVLTHDVSPTDGGELNQQISDLCEKDLAPAQIIEVKDDKGEPVGLILMRHVDKNARQPKKEDYGTGKTGDLHVSQETDVTAGFIGPTVATKKSPLQHHAISMVGGEIDPFAIAGLISVLRGKSQTIIHCEPIPVVNQSGFFQKADIWSRPA